VPNHFLGVEGASVSFGKRDAQVRALRGVSQFLRAWDAFTGDGTLRERENHIVIAAWLFIVTR